MDYGYSSSKYYSSSDNQYSSEDSASYTTDSKYRSCSPLSSIEQLPIHREEFNIPTRQRFITTSKTTHDPLQFVSKKSAAVELTEQARQQIEVVEQQKRLLQGFSKRMPRQFDDDETSWQSNLDSWLSKRKAVTSQKTDVSDTAEHMKQRTHLRKIPELKIKDKEEILTISSSSPLDEHTDSGIENNRSNSNLQSPSTSLDFSPRSDSRQSGYQSGSFSPKYFVRTTYPSAPGAPLTPPPLPPDTVEILQKSIELDDIATVNSGTLLQIDTNKAGRRDNPTKLDQVVIGFALPKKSYGSDYSSVGGRTLYSDSENEFPVTLAADIAKDELETTKFDRTTPLDSRVDSALPEQDYDSTLSESNSGTLENVERVTPPLKQQQQQSHQLQAINGSGVSSSGKSLQQQGCNIVKGISLGVELQREQSANITAIKFPVKKQNLAAEKTFRSQTNGKESNVEDSAGEAEMAQSEINCSYKTLYSREDRDSSRTASEKKQSSKTIKGVDIEFDNQSHSTYQPKLSESFIEDRQPNADGALIVNIDLGYHSKNPRKYFGFTVGGGKDKDVPPHVESIISGTPAEESGLKVGDIIITVNGESVNERYHQTIMRMLREAALLGEVELKVMRPEKIYVGSSGSLSQNSATKSDSRTKGLTSFDEKRAKFNEKIEEQSVARKVQEYKKRLQTSKWSNQRETFEKQKQNNYKSPPPAPPKTVTVFRDSEQSPPISQPSPESETRMTTISVSTSRSSPVSDSDYKVTSLHDKPGPGKLADFVPEVERGNSASRTRRKYVLDENDDVADFVSSTRRQSEIEEPKILRNFDVPTPTKSIPITLVPTAKKEPEVKQPENHVKAQMQDAFKHQTDHRSHWKEFPKTLDFTDAPNENYEVINYEKETVKKEFKKSLNSAGEDKRVTFGASEIHEITPRQTQEIVFPEVPSSEEQQPSKYDDLTPPLPRLLVPESSKTKDNFSHKPVERIHPIKLSGRPDPEGRILLEKMGAGAVPVTYHFTSSYLNEGSSTSTSRNRSSSYDDLYSHIRKAHPRNWHDNLNATWNGHEDIVSQRNYQSHSAVNHSKDISSSGLTQRHMSRSLSPTTLKNELEGATEQSTERGYAAPELMESVDLREWWQYIEEQRYPSGTKGTIERDPKFHVVHSSITNSKNNTISSTTSTKTSSSRRHVPPIGITEATRLNRGDYSSSGLQNGNSYGTKSQFLSRESEMSSQQTKERNIKTTTPLSQTKKELGDWNADKMTEKEPVVAVSGRHRCSHCQMELGRGAAMIIESLNLFYHLSCFRCYVCNAALGNGAQGADVRVRDSKLHCQNCYCNEEAGLKYSQV